MYNKTLIDVIRIRTFTDDFKNLGLYVGIRWYCGIRSWCFVSRAKYNRKMAVDSLPIFHHIFKYCSSNSREQREHQ